jgi:hypothetical protein
VADLEITGAEKFAVVARALKQAGDKELSKELYAALNRSTKSPRQAARERADERLPRRGGLNRRVARARLSTRRAAGKNPGVKIVAKGLDQLARIDAEGKVRHPTPKGGKWVDQDIPNARGWFTEPMQAAAPEVRRELVRALDEVARKLARKY